MVGWWPDALSFQGRIRTKDPKRQEPGDVVPGLSSYGPFPEAVGSTYSRPIKPDFSTPEFLSAAFLELTCCLVIAEGSLLSISPERLPAPQPDRLRLQPDDVLPG